MVSFNLLRYWHRRALIFLITGALFAAIIWVLNTFFSEFHPWNQFYTESNISTYYCEKTFMDKLVRQPINTFSNFIYWMAAVAILVRGWKDQNKKHKYNIICANPFYSILYGLILLYTFAASTIYHASLIHLAARLDFSAVYSLVLFPLMYLSHRIWLHQSRTPSNTYHPKSMRAFIIFFTFLYALFTFLIPTQWDDPVILCLIFLIIVFEYILEKEIPGRTNRYYLLICSSSILIAVVWFLFDKYKIWCHPNSLIQPHSLWHLFAGTAAFYFYVYIRSETHDAIPADTPPTTGA